MARTDTTAAAALALVTAAVRRGQSGERAAVLALLESRWSAANESRNPALCVVIGDIIDHIRAGNHHDGAPNA